MKIAVVVAHPDDEVIGTGGYLKDAVEAGSQVKIIICTHGDGNRFDTELAERALLPTPREFIEEGERRAKESIAAVRVLGIRKDDVVFLGFPDRGLSRLLKKNWEAPYRSPYTRMRKTFYAECAFRDLTYTGANLLHALKEILGEYGPDIVLTHHPRDLHGDHRAIYQFMLLALKDVSSKPSMLSFLVHWRIYQFPEPLRLLYHYPLNPPKALLKKYRWLAYPLSYHAEHAKEDAMEEFGSQLKSPSLRLLLRAFIRTNELFCDARSPIMGKKKPARQPAKKRADRFA